MILDLESPKYLGNDEGLLNIELMMKKLYHVIAYSLAKSRAAQKGNKYAKEHRRNLKVIDSDAKVAEMYEDLRKMGRRDAQHCFQFR